VKAYSLIGSIGPGIRKLQGPYDLYTSRASWPTKNCRISTVVSDTVSLILEFPTDDRRAVVKPLLEDECLDPDSGSEDSDCESHLEQGDGSTSGDQVDEKKESDRESLPVLATGSFARYAQYHVMAEPELLTLFVAGDRCSSICAQAR